MISSNFSAAYIGEKVLSLTYLAHGQNNICVMQPRNNLGGVTVRHVLTRYVDKLLTNM